MISPVIFAGALTIFAGALVTGCTEVIIHSKTFSWHMPQQRIIVGPHRMREVRTTAIDDPGRLSVCLSRAFTRHRCANTAERIEVLLGVETGDARNFVLDASPDFSRGFDASFARLLRPLVTSTDACFAVYYVCCISCYCYHDLVK